MTNIKKEVIARTVKYVQSLTTVLNSEQLKLKVIEELRRNGYQTEADALCDTTDINDFLT